MKVYGIRIKKTKLSVTKSAVNKNINKSVLIIIRNWSETVNQEIVHYEIISHSSKHVRIIRNQKKKKKI